MILTETINVWYAFGFAFIGRLFDVLSTFRVTPTMKLEGNKLARRYGRKFVYASLALALLAFMSPFMGIAIGTLSCVMALSNMQTAPLVRLAGGEEAFAKVMYSSKAAATFKLRTSLLDIMTITLPVICIGLVLLLAVGPFDQGVVAGVAYGLLGWAAAIITHRLASVARILKRRRAARDMAHPETNAPAPVADA